MARDNHDDDHDSNDDDDNTDDAAFDDDVGADANETCAWTRSNVVWEAKMKYESRTRGRVTQRERELLN